MLFTYSNQKSNCTNHLWHLTKAQRHKEKCRDACDRLEIIHPPGSPRNVLLSANSVPLRAFSFFHLTSCCVKILDRNYAVDSSYVSPFQGFADGWVSEPRALPWAGMSRPFRANSNIADQPFVSRFCHCPWKWMKTPCTNMVNGMSFRKLWKQKN